LPAAERPGFWATYIRADAALQAVRRLPAFAELDAEMSRRK
jgi:hypothetical protein